jgi:hypothetical protein
MVIGTDCIGSCKSNYHMITTTRASVVPFNIRYTLLSSFEIKMKQVSECVIVVEQVSKFSAIFHGENKLHFNEMTMMSPLY